MKVRFGIIGPGNIAKKMAQAINLCEDTQLYAVASRNIKKAEFFGQKFGAEKAYGGFDRNPDFPPGYHADGRRYDPGA